MNVTHSKRVMTLTNLIRATRSTILHSVGKAATAAEGQRMATVRKNISVSCQPTTRAQIDANAASCGMQPSAFLRELGLGYKPKSVIDAQAIHSLSRLNGELGRVGGLLRMWLSNRERRRFGDSLNVPELVEGLDRLRSEISEKVSEL